MKATLVFEGWSRNGEPVPPEEYAERSCGSFHHGSVFRATVNLNAGDAADIAEAAESGAYPVFKLEIEEEPIP